MTTKPGQAAISLAVLEKEIGWGFVSRGLYQNRLGYFVHGLAIGTELFTRDQLTRLRKKGHYLRRKHPIPPPDWEAFISACESSVRLWWHSDCHLNGRKGDQLPARILEDLIFPHYVLMHCQVKTT